MTLTEAGENFLPYARRTLAVLAEGVDAAQGAQTGQYGRVTVGAVDSISDGLLVPVVARFRAAHREVRLSVRTGHTPQILQELADGIVRLGLDHLGLSDRHGRGGGIGTLPRATSGGRVTQTSAGARAR